MWLCTSYLSVGDSVGSALDSHSVLNLFRYVPCNTPPMRTVKARALLAGTKKVFECTGTMCIEIGWCRHLYGRLRAQVRSSNNSDVSEIEALKENARVICR